jgi:hypothetical protein
VLSADGSDDGLFRCEDVERGGAPRLVVLSSCRTASGPTRKGDPGSADMGGAWLAAGAQAVVLSHADLRFEEAARTSLVLHRALAEGGSPAEGLRAARAELLESLGAESRGEAPFRCGMLGVVGLGQRAVFEVSSAVEPKSGGSARFLVTAVAVALAAGFLLGLAWRRLSVERIRR